MSLNYDISIVKEKDKNWDEIFWILDFEYNKN